MAERTPVPADSSLGYTEPKKSEIINILVYFFSDYFPYVKEKGFLCFSQNEVMTPNFVTSFLPHLQTHFYVKHNKYHF